MKNSAFDGTQGRLSTERHPFFPQESALFQHPLPHLGERRCAARPGRLPSGGPPMFASHHTAAARGPPPGQSSASRASPLPSQPSGRARAPTPQAAARRPRPGLWKEAGAAATASPPPPLGFTWPGSPRCPDCPHRRRASSDQGDGPLSEALARQPLHLSNSLRVWCWRPPS